MVMLCGWSLVAQIVGDEPVPRQQVPASGKRSVSQVHDARSAAGETAAHWPYGIENYSPLAAAGGYRHQRATFWEFWWGRINPSNFNYGAWIEQRRQVFLEQVGANRYFWFSFWEFAALCFLLLWLGKERMDRKDGEWEAAECLADLANYADYCKRHALEAITQYNEHIEICNRVIESAQTGAASDASAHGADWKTQAQKLGVELAQKTADTVRLTAALEQKAAMVDDLSARVDELARVHNGRNNDSGAASNIDLVARLNRLTEEAQALRQENSRLKREKQNASGGERVR
jgi:hypothetical protein